MHTPTVRARIGLLLAVIIVSLGLPIVGSSSVPAGAASGTLTNAECQANRQAGTITYVSPFGYDASGGIIDVFAAEKLGYFKDMCLSVSINAASQTGNELVSAGRAQVTNNGSAADQLAQNVNGANIVGVATLADSSLYALLTQKNIGKLSELPGKTLGYYTSLPLSIRAMLARAHVDIGRINMVSLTNFNPDILIQGQVNALQAYQSNEVIELRSQGKAFNEFTPSEFGVAGTYNVMGFNGTFLKTHPRAVADWMRADLHALDYCIAHQSQCVAIEHQAAVAAGEGSAFPLRLENEVWRYESALIVHHTLPGAGYGVESYGEWTPEARQLVQFGVSKTVPSVDKWEDPSLVAGLYRGKNLIWP